MLRTLENVSRTRYVPAYAMALINAGLGRRDAVFVWLQRAFDARDMHLIYLPVDPKWDSFRADASLRSAHRAVRLPANREPGLIALGGTDLRGRVSHGSSSLSRCCVTAVCRSRDGMDLFVRHGVRAAKPRFSCREAALRSGSATPRPL